MFHLYGLFIGIAVVVWFSVVEKIEPKVSKIASWILVGALVGARTWHVIESWSYYGQNLTQIVAVWNGGLAIWGGLLGGWVGLVIVNHKLSISPLERRNILGAIVTALPLSQAIGRIGNGVNGEFGQLVWVIPWWGAEALLDLILFGVIWRVKQTWPSQVIWVYLLGYGLIRLVLQPYRM